MVGSGVGENRARAQVLELIYLGDHIRCPAARSHGNDDFIVKVPNSRGQRRH